jgi:hypothetical protein
MQAATSLNKKNRNKMKDLAESQFAKKHDGNNIVPFYSGDA